MSSVTPPTGSPIGPPIPPHASGVGGPSQPARTVIANINEPGRAVEATILSQEEALPPLVDAVVAQEPPVRVEVERNPTSSPEIIGERIDDKEGEASLKIEPVASDTGPKLFLIGNTGNWYQSKGMSGEEVRKLYNQLYNGFATEEVKDVRLYLADNVVEIVHKDGSITTIHLNDYFNETITDEDEKAKREELKTLFNQLSSLVFEALAEAHKEVGISPEAIQPKNTHIRSHRREGNLQAPLPVIPIKPLQTTKEIQNMVLSLSCVQKRLQEAFDAHKAQGTAEAEHAKKALEQVIKDRIALACSALERAKEEIERKIEGLKNELLDPTTAAETKAKITELEKLLAEMKEVDKVRMALVLAVIDKKRLSEADAEEYLLKVATQLRDSLDEYFNHSLRAGFTKFMDKMSNREVPKDNFDYSRYAGALCYAAYTDPDRVYMAHKQYCQSNNIPPETVGLADAIIQDVLTKESDPAHTPTIESYQPYTSSRLAQEAEEIFKGILAPPASSSTSLIQRLWPF